MEENKSNAKIQALTFDGALLYVILPRCGINFLRTGGIALGIVFVCRNKRLGVDRMSGQTVV